MWRGCTYKLLEKRGTPAAEDLLEMGRFAEDSHLTKGQIHHPIRWNNDRGHILPTQTILHYYRGNPSTLPYTCIVWSPQMWNLMTPGSKRDYPHKLLGHRSIYIAAPHPSYIHLEDEEGLLCVDQTCIAHFWRNPLQYQFQISTKCLIWGKNRRSGMLKDTSFRNIEHLFGTG